MRVKIGNVWFNSDEEPICIQISLLEQTQIGAMNRDKAPNGKYAVFPATWERETKERKLAWMDE